MRVDRKLVLPMLAVAGALALSACGGPREDYATELGFYQDGKLRWDISGSYPSFEACKEVAFARHEVYTRQDREFSWACLKRDPETGEYTNRYR